MPVPVVNIERNVTNPAPTTAAEADTTDPTDPAKITTEENHESPLHFSVIRAAPSPRADEDRPPNVPDVSLGPRDAPPFPQPGKQEEDVATAEFGEGEVERRSLCFAFQPAEVVDEAEKARRTDYTRVPFSLRVFLGIGDKPVVTLQNQKGTRAGSRKTLQLHLTVGDYQWRSRPHQTTRNAWNCEVREVLLPIMHPSFPLLVVLEKIGHSGNKTQATALLRLDRILDGDSLGFVPESGTAPLLSLDSEIQVGELNLMCKIEPVIHCSVVARPLSHGVDTLVEQIGQFSADEDYEPGGGGDSHSHSHAHWETTSLGLEKLPPLSEELLRQLYCLRDNGHIGHVTCRFLELVFKSDDWPTSKRLRQAHLFRNPIHRPTGAESTSHQLRGNARLAEDENASTGKVVQDADNANAAALNQDMLWFAVSLRGAEAVDALDKVSAEHLVVVVLKY